MGYQIALAAALVVACGPVLSGPTQRSELPAAAAQGRVLYLTDASNGAGLIPIDPVTLQDASTKPLLPIHYTGANNSAVAVSLDGASLAVMNYWYSAAPAGAPDPKGLTISLFDARTGRLRARFNPEVPVIVDGLGPDGSRIYSRSWPPAGLTAERIVLDAKTGRVLEREPEFSRSGDQVNHVTDEHTRRMYSLLTPSDPNASGPRAVELEGRDLRTGTRLWRLQIPALAAGRWITGRVVAGRPLYSSLTPGLALSPDGRQLAVVKAFDCCVPGGTLWLIDAETGHLISERDYRRDVSFLERLLAPSVAEAKTWDESASVSAAFSPDGALLHVHGQRTTVDSEAEPSSQYLGMTAIRVRDASVLGSDVKMERGWYDNRMSWVRSSPDGRWLYVFLERTGSNADPKGYVLRRLDPSTLRVHAERRFDGWRQAFWLAAP